MLFKSFLQPSGSPIQALLVACFLSARSLGWEPDYSFDTLLLGKTSATVIILPSVGRLPRDVSLDYTTSLPFLPILLWVLLYIFSCGKSFLLVFRLFSQKVAL